MSNGPPKSNRSRSRRNVLKRVYQEKTQLEEELEDSKLEIIRLRGFANNFEDSCEITERNRELQREIAEKREELYRLAEKNQQLTDKISDQSKAKDGIEETNRQLTVKLGAQSKAMTEIEASNRELIDKLTAKSKTISEIEGSNRELTDKLAAKSKAMSEIERNNRELTDKLAAKSKTISEIEGNNRELTDKLAAKSKTISEIEGNNRELTDKLAAQAKVISEIEGNNRELTDKLAAQAKAISEIERNNRELKERLDDAKRPAYSDGTQKAAAESINEGPPSKLGSKRKKERKGGQTPELQTPRKRGRNSSEAADSGVSRSGKEDCERVEQSVDPQAFQTPSKKQRRSKVFTMSVIDGSDGCKAVQVYNKSPEFILVHLYFDGSHRCFVEVDSESEYCFLLDNDITSKYPDLKTITGQVIVEDHLEIVDLAIPVLGRYSARKRKVFSPLHP